MSEDHSDTALDESHARLAGMRLSASSQSIAAHLAGYGKQDGAYPRDAGDFERCEGLLRNFPRFNVDLQRMAEVNAYWAALVPRWDEISNGPQDQKNALIQSIIAPIQKADPHYVPLGGGASMRLGANAFKGSESDDDLFSRAVMLVWQEGVASTSFIQRRLEIGYSRAAELIKRMEELAIVSKPDHVGKRKVHSPDKLRAALEIRQEIADIAGDKFAPILLKALIAGLKIKPTQEKPPMAGKGHNSDAYSVTADELRQFIERFEQLESEKKDVAEQQKEMKQVIALRKRKPDDIAEEEAVLEMYKTALGMV
jgi:uncharacterized protein (UPF0335 family)